MGRIRSQANEFHVFKCPQKHVTSRRFVAEDEVKEAVTWLQTLDTDFYYKGI